MTGRAVAVETESAASNAGIFVGATRAAAKLEADFPSEIAPDVFRILVRDGKVILVGATEKALPFAVSRLLHEGGARWYAPTALGEVIPRKFSWRMRAMNRLYSPAFASRIFYAPHTDSQAIDAWSERNGLWARYSFTHNLNWIFTPEVFAAHPEWFGLGADGQRNGPRTREDYFWQPNFALPEVAEFAAQAAVREFSAKRDLPSFSLGMNDSVNFDQSAATEALVEPLRFFRGKPDYSPLIFTFMNRAAESVSKTHPDRLLGCLAYFVCENVPAFAVHPQVMPYITTDRSQFYDAAYRAGDRDLIRRWCASGARVVGIYDYNYGAPFLIPRIFHRELLASTRDAHLLGVRAYFAESNGHMGFDAFKNWSLARLMWEPSLKYEQLADDFFPGYYGPAGKSMRAFFELCETVWMSQRGAPYWIKFYQQEDQILLFDGATLEKLSALLAQALSEAKTPEQKLRVGQTQRAFGVTLRFADVQRAREKLQQLAWSEADFPEAEALVAAIRASREAVRALEAAQTIAVEEPSAMRAVDLPPYVRNDATAAAVWRCLDIARDQCIEEEKQPTAVAAKIREFGDLIATAAVDAWWRFSVAAAPNLAANGSFESASLDALSPKWLFKDFGELPGAWRTTAVPAEKSRAAIIESAQARDGARVLRIENAWDTQVSRWMEITPGALCVFQAQLRGKSSLGNDSSIYLTFLDAQHRVVGTYRMQSLVKGESGWRHYVLADVAPETAAWVGIGVGALRQTYGDWLEADAFRLHVSIPETK